MRVVLYLLLAVAAVMASDASVPNTDQPFSGSHTTLSFEENKQLIRKEIKLMYKKHRRNTQFNFHLPISKFPNFPNFIPRTPTIDEMPKTWINFPGIGPRTTSDVTAAPYRVGFRPAFTCQIDCKSKMNGVPAYNTCAYQFYKYGAWQIPGCFAQDRLTEAQIDLVKKICQQINGCSQRNWAINRVNVASAVGINTLATLFRNGGQYYAIP